MPAIVRSGSLRSWAATDAKRRSSSLDASRSCWASRSASSAARGSVRSRVTLPYPMRSPDGSRMAVMTTSAQKVVPSLRTRNASSS